MIRFQTEFELPTCSVDPVSLTALALGGIASTAVSAMSGGGSAPTPAAPPAMAAPQQSPTGSKTQPQSNQPSFVGASAVPSNQGGQKTLLGQ